MPRSILSILVVLLTLAPAALGQRADDARTRAVASLVDISPTALEEMCAIVDAVPAHGRAHSAGRAQPIQPAQGVAPEREPPSARRTPHEPPAWMVWLCGLGVALLIALGRARNADLGE